MKRIIVTGAVSALAAVSFAGTASAAPSEAACFGQVHKQVNEGLLAELGVNNVGQLVQSDLVNDNFGKKGQGKNAAATALFCS